MKNLKSFHSGLGRWLGSDREVRIFIIAIFMSFIAKGAAAIGGAFGVDDILFINSVFDGAAVEEVSFRDGRLLLPIFLELLWQLGIDAQKSTSISFVVFTLCLILTAQLACRIWQIEENFYACLCVVLFATLHPYQADFLTWKIGVMASGIPMLLSFYGLWCAVQFKSRYSVAFGALCIAASLNLHQIGISWVAVSVCFSFVFALLKGNPNIKESMDSTGVFLQLKVVAFGVALYIAALIFFKLLWGVSIKGRALYEFDLYSIASQASNFVDIFIHKNQFFSLSMDLLFVFAFLAFLLVLARSIWVLDATSGIRFGILAIAVLAILTAAASCVIFPIVTLQKDQLFPRTMSALGLFWGALYAFLIFSFKQRKGRKLLLGSLVTIFFVFISVNNQIFGEQIRANNRDIELGREIINRIVELDGYHFVERVAIVGVNSSSLTGLRFPLDLSDAQSLKMGVVMSIFANKYDNQYKVSLLNEALGGNFLGELNDAQTKEATSYCKYSLMVNGRFPATGSFVRSGSLAIVCL